MNSSIAARRQSSPALLFDCDPTATYIFVPARLKTMLRVEWPPVGRSSSFSGSPCAFRSPFGVLEAHERRGVADVEIAVVERQTERRGHRARPRLLNARRRRARRRAAPEDRAVDRRVHRRRRGSGRSGGGRWRWPPAAPRRRQRAGRRRRPARKTLRASNTPSLFASRSTVMLLAAGELTNRSPFGAYTIMRGRLQLGVHADGEAGRRIGHDARGLLDEGSPVWPRWTDGGQTAGLRLRDRGVALRDNGGADEWNDDAEDAKNSIGSFHARAPVWRDYRAESYRYGRPCANAR